jgi:TonB-dependent starch-binding outer membrane protein SusC
MQRILSFYCLKDEYGVIILLNYTNYKLYSQFILITRNPSFMMKIKSARFVTRIVVSTKRLIPILAFLFAALVTNAQNKTVTGKVTDDKNTPLGSANVQQTGNVGNTVNTKVDGTFSISVPTSTKSLVISYVGYEKKTVNIGNDNYMEVQLTQVGSKGDEVVVVGYQVRKKRDEAGAISSIKASQIENQPNLSLDKALQGKAAGVLVQANNGIPGGSINVRIRGEASLNAGNSPLYVIDGVQINTRNDGAFTQANPLAFLSPDDIESIDVIKDAATAAIYGSTASNGVVLVTTKKGKAGKTKFGLNFSVGQITPLLKAPVLNSQQFYQLRAEAVGNANNLPATSLAVKQNVLTFFRVPGANTMTDAQADAAAAALPTYDWQDESFTKGLVRNIELYMSGGTDKAIYRISASTQLQETFVTKADFNRQGVKFDLTNKPNDKLTFTTSINLSSFKQNNPFATDGSFLGSPAFSAPAILPMNPVRNTDGSYYGIPGQTPFASLIGTLNQNIVAVNDFNSGFTRTNQLVANFSPEYKIKSWLTLKLFGGLDYRVVQGKNVRDQRTPDGFGRKGIVNVQSNWNTNKLVSASLAFNKAITSVHKIDGVVGTEYRDELNESITATGDGFPTFEFTNLNSAANPFSVGEFYTGFKRNGIFAGLNYNYDSKYLVGVTARYDGSSRFSAKNRYGTFGGIKLGWNMDRENFLINSKVVSQLRLRVSTGSTGQDQIGNFDALGLFGSGGIYNGNAGTFFNQLENPTLKWETTTDKNIGIDFGLFKNRITGSFEVYQKNTKDLLLTQPVQLTTGFAGITSNIGKLRNQGIELTINADVIRAKDTRAFKWDVTFVAAQNKQKVTELYGGNQILPSDPSIRVGEPVNVLFTQRYAGVNPATGRPMWLDTFGNLTYQVAARDRVVQGPTRLPIYTFGFTNNISYKGFTLTAFFQGEYGRYSTDGQVNFLTENLARINELQYIYDNRWTTPGQLTYVPRMNANGAETKGSGAQSGNRMWFKADYIRLKNVMLSYDFSSKILSKLKISNARFYVQGTNLFTYSDWYGYDVEFVGTATGIIPQSKNVTMGIQIGF